MREWDERSKNKQQKIVCEFDNKVFYWLNMLWKSIESYSEKNEKSNKYTTKTVCEFENNDNL